MPGSRLPMSSRPRQRAPPRVAIHSTSSAVSQRSGGCAEAMGEEGLPRFRQHVRGVVAGGAVDPQADGHPRVEHVPYRSDAGAEAEVRRRAVRDAGAGLAEERDLLAVQADAVGEPDVGAQPAHRRRNSVGRQP